jgi:hypothetical protein
MAAPSFRPTKRQLDELAVVCELGPKALAQVRQRLEDRSHPTVSRRKIQEIIGSALGVRECRALTGFLMSVAVAIRQRSLTPKDFSEELDSYLKSFKDDTRSAQWNECRRELELLLDVPSIKYTAKALDISYDFERVFLAERLITSIRPIFNDEKNEIVGSTIVQTLRLEFASQQGEHTSLSIALDLDDVEKLQKSCGEAILKAKAAVVLIETKCRIEAIMIGEEDE